MGGRREDGSGPQRGDDRRRLEVNNSFHGDVYGILVQAGEIHGGVHVHGPDAGAVPVLTSVTPSEAADEQLVGRAAELEEVLARWSPEHREPAGAVTVVAGMGGVGKTALVRRACAVAVRREWFPGGTVLVDMQGYEPAGDRVRAAGLFAPLLRELGVAPEDVPTAQAEQATVYHQLLGLLARQERRVLLVLDNVSSIDQVRDLLPRHPVHRVAVTTRDALPLPGVHTLELDVLGDGAACELLLRLLDHDPRVSEVPGAAERLVRLCGRLPLAVGIVGAILAEDPDLTVTDLLAELDSATDRLATLERGASAVGVAFDVSWQRLLIRDPPGAGLLKLLTLNPGPDLSTDAAAALLGRDAATVRPRLRALRRAHLLQLADGRWLLHDLVRLHVRDRAVPRQKGDGGPTEAVRRLLEHYRQAAARHADSPDATAWFARERANLLAAVPLATAVGRPDITVDLTESIAGTIMTERYETGARIALVRHARDAVEQLDDPGRHLDVLHWLSHLLMLAGRNPEAITVLQDALGVARAVGDETREIATLLKLGGVFRRDQQMEKAADACRRALRSSRATRDRQKEAHSLEALATVLSVMRQHDEAISTVRQAVDIARTHDIRGVGDLLGSMGGMFARANRAAEAFATLEEAADVSRAEGDRESEAFAWANLAFLHAQLGQHGKLARAQQKALEIYRAIGDTEQEGILLTNIGMALTQMGGLEEGVRAHQKDVEACRAVGDRRAEADALSRMGAYLSHGLQVSAACTAHRKAVEIWQEIGNRHREGIELSALARALFAAGRRTAAEKTAEEAVEALLDSGDPARAAAIQEWVGALPERKPVAAEPDEPTSSTVTAQPDQHMDCCYSVLLVIALPFLHHSGGPWWVLTGCAVLLPLLQKITAVTVPFEKRMMDAPPPEMAHSIQALKGCLLVVLAVFASAVLVTAGSWWLLAFCTVLVVIGVTGKARFLLYAIIGGVTAHHTWGTWWVLIALVIPFMWQFTPITRVRNDTAKIDIG